MNWLPDSTWAKCESRFILPALRILFPKRDVVRFRGKTYFLRVPKEDAQA